MKSRTAATLASVLLASSLAGCKVNPAPGTNGSNAAPQTTDTCGGYSWCTTQAAPNPVIDAQPPGGGVPVDPPYEDDYTSPGKDCIVNLSPTSALGISFVDNSHHQVQAKVSLICAVPPQVLSMTVKLQFKNAMGNWIDEAPLQVIHHPVPDPLLPMVPRHMNPQAACYTGLWRIDVYWQGLKHNGSPFPDPGDPADMVTAPQQVNC